MTKVSKISLGATLPLLLAIVVLAIPVAAQNAGPLWQIAGTTQPSVSTVNVAGGGSYLSGKLTIAAGAGGVASLTSGGGITASASTGAVTLGSTAGGDLAGTVSSATVGGIQGRVVSNASPSSGQVLQWISGSSDWEPTTAATTVNSKTCNLNGSCQTPWEFNFAFKNSNANHAPGGIHAQTVVTNAVTLQSVTSVVEDVGANIGNWVASLCDDGATCAAGHVYATCTVACTAAAGTITACTLGKTSVAASTTISWSVSSPCNTTDPGTNVTSHFTYP